MSRAHFNRNSRYLRFAALASILILAGLFAGTAQAQNDDQTRTVFVIGNINGAFTFPLRAYSVSGDQLVLAHTWTPLNRDGGPVGLAVDPIVQKLFVSYEFSDIVDVFDATDATPLGQIQLTGTADLCGMTVDQANGILFVVDRLQLTVWEFDTTTYQLLDQWTLPTGFGAIDLEYFEDYQGAPTLFVTDSSNTIRWYDVDTHLEAGNATQVLTAAVGLGVWIKDNGYAVLYTGSEASEHGFPEPPFMVALDTETSTATQLNFGSTARGISVAQQSDLIYVSVGPVGFTPSSIRVVDAATFTELNRYNFPNVSWSPTDVESTWLAFGSDVQKTSTSHPTGEADVGDEITFEITIENRNSRPIHVLPLQDDYDPAQLTFVSADPTPDNVDTVNGLITWNDLIPGIGHDLEFQESTTVTVVFTAAPTSCTQFVDGTNVAIMSGAEDDRGTTLDDSSGSFAYRIWCTCLVDADCEDDIWCNGTETCVDRQCISSGNPCPIDDGFFCNGDETIVCIEETQECGHTGNPCPDDGNLCNGDESCDEDAGQCVNTGNPCEDDGLFCNGDEFCDPTQIECQHTGDPCEEGELCIEETDQCKAPEDDEPDPDDEGLVAELIDRNIAGGGCGCGSSSDDDDNN